MAAGLTMPGVIVSYVSTCCTLLLDCKAEKQIKCVTGCYPLTGWNETFCFSGGLAGKSIKAPSHTAVTNALRSEGE